MKFDSYHPGINFIFFVSVITFAILFTQPVFLLVGYLCAFIYSTYLGKKKVFVFNILLFILVLVYVWYYSYYNHFGVTNLTINVIGNSITLEAICMGAVRGSRIVTVIMWFVAFFNIVSTDKIIYLLGKISPKLSLFLSILLRAVPRIGGQFARVNQAQKGMGRGIGQGNFFRRIRNGVRIFSIVLTWFLENLVMLSASMKSRGYSLRGRSAYSLYRFDNRDRGVVILLFYCLIFQIMGILFDQTKMHINPQIILNPITPLSWVFYGAYAFLCLLPMLLQIIYEYRFAKQRKNL